MAKEKLIARAPLTMKNGKQYRPGDTFEGSHDDIVMTPGYARDYYAEPVPEEDPEARRIADEVRSAERRAREAQAAVGAPRK